MTLRVGQRAVSIIFLVFRLDICFSICIGLYLSNQAKKESCLFGRSLQSIVSKYRPFFFFFSYLFLFSLRHVGLVIFLIIRIDKLKEWFFSL